MSLQIYNTLSGKKEPFKPLKKGSAGMYSCGPTVYDTAHIGNFRTFMMNDIIRRVFEYEGYAVTHVMNITDVDDKILQRSRDEKISVQEITRKYEQLFFADLHALNILTPHRVLHAQDYVKEMIDMIATLLEKGIAYPTKDGIYFSIGMFPNYGKLANIQLDAEVRERIANSEYEKENPRDFALWKFFGQENTDVQWDAPFGKGRPGWSIECSAMATWALGPTIDVHTGGTDLIFPHHTNEIAQSEAATGQKFVNYWVHGAFMNVSDEKMSKSKGNFLKLADIEDAGISPLGYRYWLLTSHYRSQINFTIEAVKAAQTAFIRLVEAFIDFSHAPDIHHEHHHVHAKHEHVNYSVEFKAAINDDFNTPEALAIVWKMIKDPLIEPKHKADMLLDFDKVLGLGLAAVLDMSNGIDTNKDIPAEIVVLADTREDARAAKEWDKADALRIEIESRGYTVKDIDSGYHIKKKLS